MRFVRSIRVERRALRFVAVAAALAVALLLPSWAPPASAATTFTVDSTGDASDANAPSGPWDGVCDTGAGACTLRAAIEEANATPDTDSIKFSIGSGPQTIAPTTGFYVSKPITIDATTQPGYSGTPLIELRGDSAPMSSTAFYLDAPGNTIRGFVINRYYEGISVNRSDNIIERNYIGLDASGSVDPGGSTYGISVTAAGTTVSGNLISKNVVSGNEQSGIRFDAHAGGTLTLNEIVGNFIGTDAAGTSVIANTQIGVHFLAFTYAGPASVTHNVIGGAAPGDGNVIAGSSINVYMLGFVTGGISNVAHNRVEGNRIGTDLTGSVLLGGGSGIYILGNDTNQSANDNIVGGTTGVTPGGPCTGACNVIAGHTGEGVLIYGDGTTQVGNVIQGNSIHSNGQPGIDLGPPAGGVTPNDPLDADVGGGNNYQNFPTITSVVHGVSTSQIDGTLHSLPSTMFKLDFYANSECDASGYGEGRTYLGATSVTTDGSGNTPFSVVLSVVVPAGQPVTATATSPTGDTSEFSAWAAPLSPDFDGDAIGDVCDADDDGDGCSDTEEGPTNPPALGGMRNPLFKHDFYDVNGSKKVDSVDIAMVRSKFDVTPPYPNYAVTHDRSPGAAVWAPGAPNGVINAVDIALVRASFNHDCTAAP